MGQERSSGRPEPGEYAEYAHADIDAVVGVDVVSVLERQRSDTIELFGRFGDQGGDLKYGPSKWTVKQVLGHLADDERIFAYRALCIARGDGRVLPAFDEEAYVRGARFESLSMMRLLDDYIAVRNASITLFRGLDARAWVRRGTVDDYAATARGLAFHIAAHERRHHRTIVERYIPLARRRPWWPAVRGCDVRAVAFR